MALALKLLYGEVVINGGRFYLKDDKVVPRGEFPGGVPADKNDFQNVAPQTIRLPDNALTDTIGDTAFTLLRLDRSGVGSDPYAEVHGEDSWRIWLNGNSAEAADKDRALNRPISYLHCHCCTCFPYYELQVNEGCVRVAIH